MLKIEFRRLADEIKEAWVPIQVAQVNDTALRIAKIEGDYRWHTHPNEDEFFFVIRGQVTLESKVGNVTLGEGEGALVPRGVPHRSRADKPSVVLIIEPVRTNTLGVPVKEEEGSK